MTATQLSSLGQERGADLVLSCRELAGLACLGIFLQEGLVWPNRQDEFVRVLHGVSGEYIPARVATRLGLDTATAESWAGHALLRTRAPRPAPRARRVPANAAHK